MKYVLSIFIIETIIIIRSGQHFIPPLPHCIHAEICNHTRLSVCGEDRKNLEHRIFNDECDMFELNCDGDREFVAVDFSVCSQPANNKETVNIYSSRRKYNGKLKKKKLWQRMKKDMVIEHATVTINRFLLNNKLTSITDSSTTTSTNIVATTTTTTTTTSTPTTPTITTTTTTTSPTPTTATATPTPTTNIAIPTPTTNTTTTTTDTSMSTIILKKETVWRNGKLYMKIVKGLEGEYPLPSSYESSGYLSS